MRLFPTFIFLTLVGTSSSVLCAPSTATPRPSLTSPHAPTPQEVPATATERSENMRWSEPEGLPPKDLHAALSSPEVARSAPWTWMAVIGSWGGAIIDKETTETSTYGGAVFTWTPAESHAWDFSADYSDKKWLRFGVTRRAYFEMYEYGPYWKAGFVQTLPSSELGSGIVDLKRVKFLGGFGLADLLDNQNRLQIEACAAWGLNGPGVQLQAGWSFDL